MVEVEKGAIGLKSLRLTIGKEEVRKCDEQGNINRNMVVNKSVWIIVMGRQEIYPVRLTACEQGLQRRLGAYYLDRNLEGSTSNLWLCPCGDRADIVLQHRWTSWARFPQSCTRW